AFKDGAFAVQDYAAQLPVIAAKPQPGGRCLDLCAAPGGKTAQLAEAVGEKGLVLAFDRSDEKLERIQQNIARLGLSNVACASGDGTTV
ncbi:MAG: methyltransferase domain-containing protein, partial [Planctomycetes bacterium]|nr:methyltransferase domain-containing protein [Planctomycetota bacterium]